MSNRKKARADRLRQEFADVAPTYENPSVWPAYIYVEPPPGFHAAERRGKFWFDAQEMMGFRVQRITSDAPGAELAIYSPWTYFYASVPAADALSFIAGVTQSTCSVIYDCHMPIMHLDQIIGAPDQIQIIRDHHDEMLANLKAACAVTVPHREWAADLVEINPNVWYLPDVFEDDPRSIAQFGASFSEMALATQRRCAGRGSR